MTASVQYNGHVLTPNSRYQKSPAGWTLEVLIKPVGRKTGGKRCRGKYLYKTEEHAMSRCLEFGRWIVDGKLRPRKK